jgi:hypothetical protein
MPPIRTNAERRKLLAIRHHIGAQFGEEGLQGRAGLRRREVLQKLKGGLGARQMVVQISCEMLVQHSSPAFCLRILPATNRIDKDLPAATGLWLILRTYILPVRPVDRSTISDSVIGGLPDCVMLAWSRPPMSLVQPLLASPKRTRREHRQIAAVALPQQVLVVGDQDGVGGVG